MRNLKDMIGSEITFTCVADKTNKKTTVENYLFKNLILDNGEIISDHMWENPKTSIRKKLKDIQFKKTVLKFVGVPYEYTRKNGSKDYGIKISKLVDKI